MTDSQGISDEVLEYIKKLSSEKDSLIAKFLAETGLSASDVCIVERQTETGRVFYPDLKSRHGVLRGQNDRR